MAFKACFLLFLATIVCADEPGYGGQQQQQQQHGNNYGDNGGGHNGGSNDIAILPSAPNGGYAGESSSRPSNDGYNGGGNNGGGYAGLIPIQIPIATPAHGGYGNQIPQIEISAPKPVQSGYGGPVQQHQHVAPQVSGGGQSYGNQAPQIQISAPNNGYGNRDGFVGIGPAPQASIAMPSVGYTKGYSINAPSGYGGHGHGGGGGAYVDDLAEERDYKFSYTVKDDYTYNQQSREENKNGNTITGQYTVLEPTGDLRIVNYVADDYGFRADVQNQGGHGPVAPAVQSGGHNGNGYGAGGHQQQSGGSYGQQQQQSGPAYGQQQHQQQHHQHEQHQHQQQSGPAYGQQQHEHHQEASAGPAYGQRDQHQQGSGVSYGQQQQVHHQQSEQQSSGSNYGGGRQEHHQEPSRHEEQRPLVPAYGQSESHHQHQVVHPILAPAVSNYGQAAPMLLIQAPIQQSYGPGPAQEASHGDGPSYNPDAPALHKPVLAAPAYRPVADIPDRKQSVGPTYGRPTVAPQKPTYGRPSAVPKPNRPAENY